MSNKFTPFSYTPAHREQAEGFICLRGVRDNFENRGFTISLTGAASMTQAELNEYAKFIVKACNAYYKS